MKLVENWKTLWKSFSVQLAFLGALLPEILQVVADNSMYLSWLDADAKNIIRFTALMLIPFARVVKQPSVSK